MARSLAAAISQAPGLPGTPGFGHCSSAATRASCARSSATPTSRTIRARPAMSRGDSILHTASIARCVSVATAADHIMLGSECASSGQFAKQSVSELSALPPRPLIDALREVFRPEYLANLGLAFPSRPVFPVKFHEADRPFDRLLLRFQFKLRIAADDFLGLGEWPIGHGQLPLGNPDASALCGWRKASVAEHRAVLDRLFGDDVNRVHKLLGRRARVLGVLDQYHELHRHNLLLNSGLWAGLSEPFRLPELSLHLHVERRAVKSTRATLIYSLSIAYDTLRLDRSCNSGNPAAASWTSAGKSDISCTWRSSITSLSEAGPRDAHSTASSFDLT